MNIWNAGVSVMTRSTFSSFISLAMVTNSILVCLSVPLFVCTAKLTN